MRRFRIAAVATSLVAAVGLAACGTADPKDSPTTSGGVTNVKLQLQWFFQAQFAGYIAAVEKGFYKDEGLNVELLEGGVDIVPQTVLAQGRADYAVAWVPRRWRPASRARRSPTSGSSSRGPAPTRWPSRTRASTAPAT